jgi:8-oxo-dGTP diphosphatase
LTTRPSSRAAQPHAPTAADINAPERATEADPPAVLLAAGGVLWRSGEHGVEVAVVHRPRYDDWSLPKGKVDGGEHLAVTARREVLEETGFRAVLSRLLPSQEYPVTGPGGHPVHKLVSFWSMRADGHPKSPAWPRPDEVDEVRWLAPESALEILSRDGDRRTLESFLATPRATMTVALVRHGSAHNKRRWSGPDDFRPLDARGSTEAARLAEVLPVFGPGRVLSALPSRCTATVQPLAARLGVPVELAAAFGEDDNPNDVDVAIGALDDVVAAGQSAVICSQGGVIPDLLAQIAKRDGLSMAETPSRKGSVWVLSFADGRLVAADYFEELAPARP